MSRLRSRFRGYDIDLAERIAACLRDLVVDTALASAADRARVRAAVHYFVARSNTHRGRALAAEQFVVNDVARRLGRVDLIVASVAEKPASGPDRDRGPSAERRAR